MSSSTSVRVLFTSLPRWQQTALILFGVAVGMTALTGQAHWDQPADLLRYFGLVSLYTSGCG
ncbi:MAG: hypothetical protein ACRYG7_13710 [Janthinobacterium lividum]